MSKHRAQVSNHRVRAPGPRHAGTRRAPRRTSAKVVRNTVVMTSLAAAATGAVVSGGVLVGDGTVPAAAGDLGIASSDFSLADRAVRGTSTGDASAEERTETVSRSDRRTSTDPAKAVALSTTGSPAVAHTESVADEDPRTIGMALLPEFGFGDDQFSCLDSLYASESGWRWNADNPSSSAYGIPQALPGSKMSSAGADWATNPATQIRWGLGYIASRYGSPCGAWSFKQGHGWY